MKNRTSVSGLSGVEDLVAATLEHMRDQGYSAGYLQLCRALWHDFLTFLGGSSAKEFSEDDIVRYEDRYSRLSDE